MKEVKEYQKLASKISGRKHFSDKWIVGADSIRVSIIKDHAQVWQIIQRLYYFEKREQAKATGASYLSSGPLAKVFNTIGEEEGIKIRVKFDIAYCIAIKKMYPKICKDTELGTCSLVILERLASLWRLSLKFLSHSIKLNY